MDKNEKMAALAKLWQGRPDISQTKISSRKTGKVATVDLGDNFKYAFCLRGVTDLAGIKTNGDVDYEDIHFSRDRLNGQSIVDFLFGDRPGLARRSIENFALKVAKEIDIEMAENLPFEKLIEQEKIRVDAFRNKLLKGIDQDILMSLLNINQGHDSSIYNWFTDQTSEKIEYRRQAIKLFPLFAKEIVQIKMIRDAVDNGESLVSALQATVASGISKATLNRLREIAVDTGILSLRMFLEMANNMPPEWIPQNNQNEIQIMANMLTNATYLIAECEFKENIIFRDVKGRWKEFRDRVSREIIVQRAPENANQEHMERLTEIAKHLEKIKSKVSIEFIKGLAEIWGEKIEAETNGALNKTHVSGWLSSTAAPEGCTDTIIRETTTEVIGMIRELVDQVVIPAGIKDIPATMSINIKPDQSHQIFLRTAKSVLGDKGFVGIIETLNTYRGNVVINRASVLNSDLEIKIELMNELLNLNDHHYIFGLNMGKSKMEWEPLTDIVQAPNGLWVVPLTNDRHLYYEGSHGRDPYGSLGLSHCCSWMNSYNSNNCFKNGHHILSVRKLIKGRYFRIGTVEYNKLSPDNYKLSRIQFKYFGNGEPPEDGVAALRWYERAIEEGEVEVNKKIFENNRLQNTLNVINGENLDDSVRSNFIRVAQYNWKEKDNFVKMYEAWSPIMPKSWRKAGPDGFVQIDDIKTVKKFAAPATVSIERMRNAMPKLTL